MLFTTRQRLLTIALAGCFGTLLTTHHPAARAQTAQQAVDIQLPAQNLAGALAALSSQTGIQIFAPGGLVAGKTAPAISGRMTPHQALDRLLDGADLRVQPGTNNSFTLHPVSLDDQALPPVRVQARAIQEEAQGPVNGLVARRSGTGTKTDTPLIEIPQSISVIGRDELDARGAQTVMEALRYVPGVSVDTYGVETRGSEWVLMRGFDTAGTSVLTDGLRMANSTWVNFQTETYGLDRIEVLRGPASVSYGQAEAGGTIHRITKRPDANAPREVTVQTGTLGRKQVSADVGGSFNADNTALFRVVALALDTDNQLKYRNGDRGSNERIYLAPSLMFRPTAATTLTIRGERLHNMSKGFSLYVVNNGQNTGVLRGDPDYLRYKQDQAQLGYQLEHRFNDTWTLRQNVRESRSSVDNHYINAAGAPAGNVLNRSAQYAKDQLRQTSADTSLEARFGQGRITHTVLAGMDWMQARNDFQRHHTPNGATPPLDLLNPVYGVAFPATSVAIANQSTRTRQLGLYLQDQIHIDQRWVLTLGGRDDVVKTQSNDRLATVREGQRDHAFSGRAGLTYLASNGLSPYVSYAESFAPQNLRTLAGEAYKPTQGKQWEIGVKFQPPGRDSLFTAAVYDLTKRNVETFDPGLNDYTQTGEVRSRGLELEAKTALTRGLDMYAAYTYNQVKVTGGEPEYLGKVPIQVPRQLASLGLNHAMDWALEGLSIGGGVRYVGARPDDRLNTRSTPSFTLFDAAVRYERGPWMMSLNVANLFDKSYVASQAYGGYYPGAERTATLSARYRF